MNWPFVWSTDILFKKDIDFFQIFPVIQNFHYASVTACWQLRILIHAWNRNSILKQSDPSACAWLLKRFQTAKNSVECISDYWMPKYAIAKPFQITFKSYSEETIQRASNRCHLLNNFDLWELSVRPVYVIESYEQNSTRNHHL